jgi:hypothetical protein
VHVTQFIARWSGGAQNEKWWEIEGLTMAIQEATKKPHFNYIFSLKTELKKASRLNNGLIHNLRMSHSLQMDIYRRGYDRQMPLEVAAASDTASASKKCPWAALNTSPAAS